MTTVTAVSLLKHVESGLSLQAKEMMTIEATLSVLVSKAHVKPKTVTLEDFNSAMLLVDKLNAMVTQY